MMRDFLASRYSGASTVGQLTITFGYCPPEQSLNKG